MFKYLLYTLTSLFISTCLKAQGNFPQTCTTAGLAMANTALHLENIDALAYNPAGIHCLKRINTSFHGTNYWGIEGINTWTFALALPNSMKDGFGLQLQGFRPGQFSFIKTGLSYGRKLTQNTAAGIQFLYHAATNIEKETNSRISAELGIQLKISNLVGFSALLHSFYPYFQQSESIFAYPDAYRMGFVFRPGDFIELAFEIHHSLYRKPGYSMGLAYHFSKDRYQWRMGFDWSKTSFSTGLGMEFLGLQLDLATLYHPDLGFTQAIGLIKKFEKAQTKE